MFLSLEQRKEQLRKQNEELIRSMPDPDQPPDHRKLPDEEKEKTLKLLQESKQKDKIRFLASLKDFLFLTKLETNCYPK